MKTIVTSPRNRRESIEAGMAALFLLLGVVLATGLLALAFASAQSVQPSQIMIHSHSSPAAGGFERSDRRGNAMAGYQVVL
jgi:hypothetical protein